MTQASDERPLVKLAEERDRELAERDRDRDERAREIHARCVTVERACAAIGFAPGSCYERVAVLVARVAGTSPLRRTVLEIARDKSVGFSAKHVRRAIEKLHEVGVINRLEEPSPEHHVVGRPPKFLRLQIQWQHVRGVVAAENAWRQEHMANVGEIEPYELGTSKGRPRDIRGASEGHPRDIQGTSDGRLADRSYVYPYSLNPSSPSSLVRDPDDGDEVRENHAPDRPADRTTRTEAAVKAAGVERVRSLLGEAAERGVSSAELIDAAFVVQHWTALEPGALFDWVRSGGWPISGVPTADVLRHERRKAAEAIRSRVRGDAAQRTPQPPEEVIQAVICKRLRSTKPPGCKTDLGDEATAAELAGEQMVNSKVAVGS